MASGSIHKHTAADGRITWRVRIDVTNPQTGKRHQPQRTSIVVPIIFMRVP